MKKGILIGGVIVLLCAAAGTVFALSHSTQSDVIRDAVQNGQDGLTAKEQSMLDLDKDGSITMKDQMIAKWNAMLHKSGSDTVIYTPDAAKQLGRTAFHEDTKTLWCSLSGSGIEFRFKGESCEFTLVGDSACTTGDTNAARYACYLNGTLAEEAQLTEEAHDITLNGSASEWSTVRFVKLSEAAQSTVGIRDICITAPAAEPAIEATEKAEHYIEFIGDSITCGYGVDGVYNVDTFKTANENAEKAYAILTAKKLGADYSLVSYSGHGVISGYTTQGNLNKNQLVPRFYTQVGHSSAVIEGRHKAQDDLWDFSVQPDVVVINLGTNDASYTGTDPSLQKEFAAAYVEFLKKIRENNPNAQIICTLGIMGQTLCDAIDLAITNYTAETGDSKVTSMRFDMQSQEDGYAVDWHPSAVTHEKASDKLAAFIREQMGW